MNNKSFIGDFFVSFGTGLLLFVFFVGLVNVAIWCDCMLFSYQTCSPFVEAGPQLKSVDYWQSTECFLNGERINCTDIPKEVKG